MFNRGGKGNSRKFKNGVQRARKFIGGGARSIKTILGSADKMSGGAASMMLRSNPYGNAGLTALDMAAYRPSQHR